LDSESDQAQRTFYDYARGEGLDESSDDDRSDNDTPSILDYATLGNGDSSFHRSIAETGQFEVDFSEDSAVEARAHPTQQRPDSDNDSDGVVPTNRIAIVNLDWDHVRAAHLYKICASVASTNSQSGLKQQSSPLSQGTVESVRIYPSQFGKDRMAREEKEGPPREIFVSAGTQDVDERNIHDVQDDSGVNEEALRSYQLDRLRFPFRFYPTEPTLTGRRYYYAIVTCDTAQTAEHVYRELDGAELERSANVFTLSFVPDDMTFDDDFKRVS
jgi:hypothetical protein